MLLTGLLFIVCCSVAFAGVLGGVMGIVCIVVFIETCKYYTLPRTCI